MPKKGLFSKKRKNIKNEKIMVMIEVKLAFLGLSILNVSNWDHVFSLLIFCNDDSPNQSREGQLKHRIRPPKNYVLLERINLVEGELIGVSGSWSLGESNTVDINCSTVVMFFDEKLFEVIHSYTGSLQQKMWFRDFKDNASPSGCGYLFRYFWLKNL